MRDPHFFQNCGHFQYNISWHQNKVSCCYIENDHNFERNEDRATVFLKVLLEHFWRRIKKRVSTFFFISPEQSIKNFNFLHSINFQNNFFMPKITNQPYISDNYFHFTGKRYEKSKGPCCISIQLSNLNPNLVIFFCFLSLIFIV